VVLVVVVVVVLVVLLLLLVLLVLLQHISSMACRNEGCKSPNDPLQK
jgi:hypothetical protein